MYRGLARNDLAPPTPPPSNQEMLELPTPTDRSSAFISLAALLLAPIALAQGAPKQVPFLGIEAARKTLELQDGYFLELVVGEPIIKEPVVAVFDGNGRMYVAEMRTYMQDVDGSKKYDPVSRVSLHDDTNGDGQLDKHTVFIDTLILPRMILPLDDRLVVCETNTLDFYTYRDTDGDGVADEKKPFYLGGTRGGNLEHQPSGLIWSQDNWLYTTYNAWRLRYTGNEVIKEPTAPNGGQWGLTQDNHGKPWFVNAGGERGPLNFQQPIVYGAFNTPDQFQGDFKIVWPIDDVPDVQGGPRRIRKDNTLNHFTATCGGEVFRGDRLPQDLVGDLLFAEPVGRLIRRTKIVVTDGVTTLSNPYEAQKDEFIRTADPNFRPINMVTAPDGTLYIVDMYRGIIQEGNWTREGSYLRKVIQEYGLDKHIGRGRIWRLRHKDFKPGPKPNMLNETPAQLVAHLAHPNGWWRDTAQKLLILMADKSVAPTLVAMAANHENYLAKTHALWTLEGLGCLDPTAIRSALKDAHPQVRIAGIRTAETLVKAGDESLDADLRAMAKDADPNVVIQAMMTVKLLGADDAIDFIIETMTANESRGVQEIGNQLSRRRGGSVGLSAADRKMLRKGRVIYKSLCFACHGVDGKGQPIDSPDLAKGTTMAPSFVGSKTLLGHKDAPIAVLLHGLTGPVEGKTYPGQMVSMKTYDDQWVAAVLSYIRTGFGNSSSMITPVDVARVRKETAERTEPWTVAELRSAMPQYLIHRKLWKFTASHKVNAMKSAVDADIKSRYDTGTGQRPGMWIAVALPKPAMLRGILLDTTGSNRDYPRGYEVSVSSDGKTWSKPVASGAGKGPITDIAFEPIEAQHVKITLTDSVKGLYWSIHEMQIYVTR